MKNKSIFIGFLIFSAGVGSGYFAGIKILKSRFKEDLAEVKDFYAAKIEELGVMPEGFDPSDIIEESEDLDDDEDDRDSEEYLARIAKYSSAVPTGQRDKGRLITNYSKPPLNVVAYGVIDEDDGEFNDITADDEDREAEVDEEYEAELEARADEFAKRMHENKTSGLPYVISFAEFEDGPEGYGRQTLYYYSVDRVLCEDDDSEVEDEEGLVGLDYEDTLDMQTTAWVRNDKVLVLYEIHRIDESYSNSVSNAQETPREREFRIMGRRKQGLDH